jgi:hypothetical protein
MSEPHALARRFQAPKMLAEGVAAGLAAIGLVCLFQPSPLAKTLSIASLLTSGSTLSLSRLNHRLYVGTAYRHAAELGDRHEVAKRQLEQSIADLQAHAQGQSAQFQQTLAQMQQSIQGYVLTESELRHTNEQLQRLVTQAEQDTQTVIDRLGVAEATLSQTQQAQQQFLAGLKATVAESIENWVGKIETLCAQLIRKCPEMEERVEQILSDLGDRQTFYQEEVENLAIEVTMMDALDQAISLLHSIYDHFGLLRIQVLNAAHTRYRQKLLTQLAAVQSENQTLSDRDVVPRDQLEQVIGNYEAAIREFRERYTQHAQETLQFAGEMEQTVIGQDPIFEKMQFLLRHQELQISKLEMRLQEANQIRTFEDVGNWTHVANQVLMHFSAHSIVCDACPIPIKETGNDIEFFITPRTQIGMNLVKSDIDTAAEALKIPLGVKNVKITIEGKNIKVRLPVREREVEKAKGEDILGRSPAEWVLYLGSQLHFAVFAATQSGKSTLLDELHALIHHQFAGDVEYRAITLKSDGNRDDNRKFIRPKLMPSHDEYQAAILLVREDIEDRNLILGVNPNHRYPRLVHSWDEFGQFYRAGSTTDRQVARDVLITGIQEGGGQTSEPGKGISIVFTAQNPNVSTYGLQRNDLKNCCVVVVGEANIRGYLESDVSIHGLDKEDVARLQQELLLFKDAARTAVEKAKVQALEQGRDAALAIRACPENYYSLVMPVNVGLKPIILYNPKPGQFSQPLLQQTNAQTAIADTLSRPTCPDCQGQSTKKRGRNGNRYDCLNPDCNRKTFTWRGG